MSEGTQGYGCAGWAFVLEGEVACCGSAVLDERLHDLFLDVVKPSPCNAKFTALFDSLVYIQGQLLSLFKLKNNPRPDVQDNVS